MAFRGVREKEDFSGQNFRLATLDGLMFKMCDFSGADLRGASIRGTQFAGCDLRGADFSGADLTEAVFSFVMTHDPNYGMCDVTGATWIGANLKRVTADRVVGWPDDHPSNGR